MHTHRTQRAFLTTQLVKGAGFHPKGTEGIPLPSHPSPASSNALCSILFGISNLFPGLLESAFLESQAPSLLSNLPCCSTFPSWPLCFLYLPALLSSRLHSCQGCLCNIAIHVIYISPLNRTPCSLSLPVWLSGRLHSHQGCLRNIAIHVVHICPSNKTLI